MVDTSTLIKVDLEYLRSLLSDIISPLVEDAVENSLSKYKLPEKKKEDEETYLSSEQAAKFLGVSTVTLYKWRKKGKLEFFRLKDSSRIYYKKSMLIQVLRPSKRSGK